ncbi:pyridoxal phosphate-dependent aminotransferase [Flavimaricola marinus]|uniref:histidinol-phosphate transaminase n=1 Tax=Flavimaricola marinus TaxID=1819565 RepID=A0A238LGZ6_9RHOB|nr:pyridoxal phosphate-dependent aminotransferase [Flavimaricola marinus]SMY08969.1 Histidinol-phosphate aminotransferase 2 [Flavimaricola marinus]
MKTDARLTPLAASLPASVPFVGPEAQERRRGAPFTARLGANENGFGPSPKAIAAMRKAAGDVWMYGDPENHDLRQALAAHHECQPENILVGEGIDALLGYTARLMVGAGDAVVTSAGAYPTFNYHVTGYGGQIHAVPYTGDYEDPERLNAKAREVGAKLIYISNPDNPMGTWHSGAMMKEMVQNVPDGALLLMDEAYIELAPPGTAPVIAATDPRVLRFRTFSKGYGMAGARIGYAIGAAPVIAAFERVRNHFGVNRIAQAGALAALKDDAWLAHVQAEVGAARTRIAEIGAQNGLTALPSATNFVTLDCGSDGAFAGNLMAALLDAGIFVRKPFAAPQDRCVRIGTGPAADLDAFATALPAALVTAKGRALL